MLIQFLGTNAGSPSIKRNVTSTALIFNNNEYEIWLFDCGEATQHQILHTSIKLSKIRKIFITHMHGDHIFGLPGLINSRSVDNSSELLEIYGVKGIKSFIYKCLHLTKSYINFPIDIYEINEGKIIDNGKYKVFSFLLNHTIECYGFRIEEIDKVGPLNKNKLISDGILPGPIYRHLKLGKNIIINNKLIKGSDYLGPKIIGKKIAILGDTAPLKYKCKYLFNLDLLIHESTLDNSLKKKANLRGHSTNIQAAYLAKKYNVKKLIINHFSSRYNEYDLRKMINECNNLFPYIKYAKDFYIYKL